MKSLVAIVVVCLAGGTAVAADGACSVVIENNPAQQISKDLKFSGAYEENFELMESSEFSVSVYATGGRFFGISVYDKAGGSIITSEGKQVTLASKNGIGSSEKLRVMCIGF